MIWHISKHNTTSNQNFQDRCIHFLYETLPGRVLLRPLVTPAFSKFAGYLLETKLSSFAVTPFVKANHISLSECEMQQFDSFNQFFKRKLRRNARQIVRDEGAFISPCDARLSVYPIMNNSHFTIKNTPYTVAELLKDEHLSKTFEGGTLWLFRLSVDDYHRYIYPITGRKSHNRYIAGRFHTVNPLANDYYPIYKENSREYCLIKGHSTTLLMMEVGALMVGKIENLNKHASYVKRGSEKGNFAFGGSTIIVLTKKGAVTPEPLFIENTRKHIETKVLLGQRVGSFL